MARFQPRFAAWRPHASRRAGPVAQLRAWCCGAGSTQRQTVLSRAECPFYCIAASTLEQSAKHSEGLRVQIRIFVTTHTAGGRQACRRGSGAFNRNQDDVKPYRHGAGGQFGSSIRRKRQESDDTEASAMALSLGVG